MDIREMVEMINKLTEGDIAEQTLTDEAPETEAEIAEEKPVITDNMSLADTLDAKAKIAHCVEDIKTAIEEFKNATAEKVDLLQDSGLMQAIEGLDAQVMEIEKQLAAGSKILGETPLNDPFKAELPAETPEIEEKEDEEEMEEESEEEMEHDFDVEAGLDLLAGGQE